MALQDFTDTAALPGRHEGHAPTFPAFRAPALAISQLASPPMLAVGCAFATATFDGRPGAYLAALAFSLLGVVLPLLALVRQWREGMVSDLEITRRDQRLWPLLLTTTCVGVGASLLQLAGAPTAVAGLASILGVQCLLLLAVTTRWKISVHCAAAASAGALVWELTGRWEPGVALGLAMIWSRLHLNRHTPLQCLAGAALGGLLMLVLWPLLGG
jgi:membrane-associated phospholipid phosphatase